MRYRLLPLLAFIFLAGCQRAPETEPGQKESFGIYPKDDLGREVGIGASVKRLIVIGPGAVETVYALGAGSRLVGRDSFATVPAPAGKVPVAGDYMGPSVEKCIALRPDLIIVQGETWDRARVESWQQQIGAPVAALTATSLQTVRQDFVKIGQWLHCEKAAVELAQSLDVKPAPPVAKAFIEIGRSPLFTAGRGTLVTDVINAAGFSNAADDIKGYQPFGLESLIARQPEVYIAPSTASVASLTRQLRASPALSKLKCIQKGQVIAIDGDYVLRPGPRLRLGIEKLTREARRFSSAPPSH